MGRLSERKVEAPVGEAPPPPEALGLADGLQRLLGVGDVRYWSRPADVELLRQLRHSLDTADVAVVCLSGGSGEPRPSLADALEAVKAADLEVAWAGLTRNGLEDTRRETPLVVVADERADDIRSALAAGTASLLFDGAAPTGASLDRPVRVCVASYEVVGPTKNGGIGTANTSLAELLSEAGHEVTLLYTGWQAIDDATRDRWTQHYKQRGVDFLELRNEIQLEVDTPHFNQARAYELYRWLQSSDEQAPWDVIHFPECQGHGYYALLARRQGLAFANCTLVVGVHSPTRWVYEANRWTLENAHRLADDFLERQCVELADVVISPSAYLLSWMELQGWRLPARRFVQHYATSGAVAVNAGDDLPEGPGTQAARELGDRSESEEDASYAWTSTLSPPDDRPRGRIDEIVFFGRLETRKGLEIFCEALDILGKEPISPGFRVTFMGSETPIEGVPAGEYLRSRGERWPWSWRMETGCNQLEAVAYIRQSGRLAVMPSPVDNSPNTVLEALGLGIPFITSRGGGIPELIHPLDLEQSTFDPAGGTVALGGQSLADAIRRATTADEVVRPRFAVDPEVNQRVHVQWHERIAAARRRRLPEVVDGERRDRLDSVSVCLMGVDDDRVRLERLRQSLERQDHNPSELVVALPLAGGNGEFRRFAAALRDVGWRVVDGRPGELDADAAAVATGEWLFLCEPYVVARPRLLSTLVASGNRLKAELVATAVSYVEEEHQAERSAWRENLPLGAAPLVGLFFDCFGVGGLLIRRECFERLGGFMVDGPPAVRRRDLLCRAALGGVRSTVVPECLLDYDREAAEKAALSPAEAQLRTLKPYQQSLPGAFVDLPGIALSFSTAPPPPPPDTAHLEEYARTLEETLEVISTSRSWRMTKPLRRSMERLRGLR